MEFIPIRNLSRVNRLKLVECLLFYAIRLSPGPAFCSSSFPGGIIVSCVLAHHIIHKIREKVCGVSEHGKRQYS
jgi:hypothetical protein